MRTNAAKGEGGFAKNGRNVLSAGKAFGVDWHVRSRSPGFSCVCGLGAFGAKMYLGVHVGWGILSPQPGVLQSRRRDPRL